MAVTHSNAALSAATNAVTALIGASGKLKFRISPSTVAAPGTAAATLSFAATAFLAAVNGVATADTITADSSATGNASPVAYATFETSGGTVVVHCAVAASGSDIDLTNGLTIAAGDTVTCTALTYKAINA